jgi:hypothetical protein
MITHVKPVRHMRIDAIATIACASMRDAAQMARRNSTARRVDDEARSSST